MCRWYHSCKKKVIKMKKCIRRILSSDYSWGRRTGNRMGRSHNVHNCIYNVLLLKLGIGFMDVHYSLDFIFFLKIPFIYILETWEGRVKERERNTDVWGRPRSAASCLCPYQGLNLQPRHMPRQGIQQDLLLRSVTPNQLSHSSQGSLDFFICWNTSQIHNKNNKE